MKIVQVLDVVRGFFNEHIAKPYRIPSIEQSEDGWNAVVEVIEEKEYMVSHAKDELIGVYKVHVSRDLEVVSFARLELRERSAIVKET